MAADTNTATIPQRVLREQVAMLHANVLGSTVADTLLAWTLSIGFYWRLGDPMVLAWLALHTLRLTRYAVTLAYYRDPRAAERSAYWVRRRYRELLLFSCVWGLAPWMFLPAGDLPMTALMMLLMLGLATCGVPAVAARWPAILAFTVPMLTGLISALAWQGNQVHLFLAACGAIYLGATLHFARRQHLMLSGALTMRFEKEALASQLEYQMAVAERASAEKTRFLAAASHDLRQPLHAIALFGAVLEKDLQGHPSHDHAARLMHSVSALGTSLDTMLDVSRLDAGVVTPALQAVPLHTLFQTLLPLFAARAEEKGLQLRLRSSPLWVRTDPVLLQRLLSNLLDNALKYTASGGVLLVARERGAQVWVDVCDTGIGIAPEHRAHIFEEFYQAHNPGRDRSQGLGIGLSIVRRLSELLELSVQVHTVDGRGSRFRVVLPQAAAQPRPAEPPSAGIQVQGLLPRRVLLLDDEADIGDAMTALLGAYGTQLQVVQDEDQARAALAAAEQHQAPFNALVCDYRLADGADGLAAALRLRQDRASPLPLLLVTGEPHPHGCSGCTTPVCRCSSNPYPPRHCSRRWQP